MQLCRSFHAGPLTGSRFHKAGPARSGAVYSIASACSGTAACSCPKVVGFESHTVHSVHSWRLCTPARPPARSAGRACEKPDLVLADRGYDDECRGILRARGIAHRIARRGTAHGSSLGRQRWVVERGFAHLHNFRRLRTRYERTPEVQLAFLTLACAILCWRRLESF